MRTVQFGDDNFIVPTFSPASAEEFGEKKRLANAGHHAGSDFVLAEDKRLYCTAGGRYFVTDKPITDVIWHYVLRFRPLDWVS
jgi:hypothetical protein